MNWLDNVSSDLDQPISAACLMHGHWLHALNPHTEPVMCRLVLDVAEPRVVAAQVIEPGRVQHLDSNELEDLSAALLAQEVHRQPQAWGLAPCQRLPAWALPSFSERQIEELERLQGYLADADEDDDIDAVLLLRDDFLRGIGMTDHDMYRAMRQPEPGVLQRRGGRATN